MANDENDYRLRPRRQTITTATRGSAQVINERQRMSAVRAEKQTSGDRENEGERYSAGLITCEIRCPLVILLRSIYGKLSLGTKEMVTKCATSV